MARVESIDDDVVVDTPAIELDGIDDNDTMLPQLYIVMKRITIHNNTFTEALLVICDICDRPTSGEKKLKAGKSPKRFLYFFSALHSVWQKVMR